MQEIYKVGPFLISYNILIIFLSGIIGYLTLLLLLKRCTIYKMSILDIFSSCILILIITWKFGGIILDPTLLLRNPYLILLLTGSNKTLLLGFIISSVYISVKIYRKVISINIFLDSLSISVLPFLLIYNLFIPEYGYPTRLPWGIFLDSKNVSYHPIHVYFVITILVIMIYLYKSIKDIGKGILFMKTTSLIGMSGLILSFLEPQLTFIMGVSQRQWMFIFLILIGFFAYLVRQIKQLD